MDSSFKFGMLVNVAAVCIIIASLREAREIVLLLLIACLAAVAVTVPMRFLSRKGVPSSISMFLMTVAFLGGGAVLTGLIESSLDEFSKQSPVYEESLYHVLRHANEQLAAFGIDLDLHSAASDLVEPARVMNWVGGLFNGLGVIFADSLLIVTLVVLLLLETSTFPRRLQTAFCDHNQTVERFQTLADGVRHYLAIKTWMSLLTGLLAGLLCWGFGLDLAFLWGLLAFLFNYIPNMGSVLAGALPVLLAVVQLGLLPAGLILLGYVLINNVIDNVVQPRFMGRGLGLSTFAVVVSLIFWGWVLGPVGMLLSIPLTMAVKIAMEGREDTRWMSVLLSADVPEAPPAPALADADSND